MKPGSSRSVFPPEFPNEDEDARQDGRQVVADRLRQGSFAQLGALLAGQVTDLAADMERCKRSIGALEQWVAQQEAAADERQAQLLESVALHVEREVARAIELHGPRLFADHVRYAQGPVPTNDSDEKLETSIVHVSPPSKKISFQVVTEELVSDLWKEPIYYKIQETIWDSCIFLGICGLKKFESMQVMVLILANFLAQLVFILAIVWDKEMTSNRYLHPDLPQALLKWRATYGHDLRYVSSIDNQPLVHQVCTDSDTMVQGALQADLYKAMDRYVGVDGGPPMGSYICLVAVYMWLLTISKEFSCITYFTRAIWAQRRGATTEIDACSGNFVFTSLSLKRVVALTVFVSVPRSMVAVALGFFGCKFLIATAEIDEIIMNSIALEVVLNVDEMTFAALMPATVCTVLEKMEPLAIPRMNREVLQLSAFTRVFALGVTLVFIYLSLLGPMVENMHLAKNNLCHGGDFPHKVAFRRESGMMKSGMVATTSDSLNSYPLAAVLHSVGCSPVGGCQPAIVPRDDGVGGSFFNREIFYGRWSVTYPIKEALKQESTQIDDMMITCLDYIRYPQILSLSILRYEFDNDDIESCEDVKARCGEKDRHLARLYCPETCGCEDPSSGLFVTAGCASSCSQTVTRRLSRMSCEDDRSFSTGLSSTDRLRNYISNFYYELNLVHSSVAGSSTGWVPSEVEMDERVQQLGCSFFSRPVSLTQVASGEVVWVFEVDFCDPTNEKVVGRRTVRALCPVTCGCLLQMSLSLGNTNESRDDHWTADDCPYRCGDANDGI